MYPQGRHPVRSVSSRPTEAHIIYLCDQTGDDTLSDWADDSPLDLLQQSFFFSHSHSDMAHIVGMCFWLYCFMLHQNIHLVVNECRWVFMPGVIYHAQANGSAKYEDRW